MQNISKGGRTNTARVNLAPITRWCLIMPFPESNRVIFKSNPLTEVICQLRFPTILEIGTNSPAEFQNKVRSSYPYYNTDKGSQALPPFPSLAALPKEVHDILERLQAPLPGQHPTHNFLTEQRSRFISLNPEFLALTEKEYVRWESFRKELEVAKDAFEEIYKPAFYSRIGLRYQDVIDRQWLDLDKPWDSLVNPALIGLLGVTELRGEVTDISSESMVSVSVVPGGLVRLRHGLRKLSSDGDQAYVIDADFFTRDREATYDVYKTLDEFRRTAGNLFRWAITPQLHAALEPVDIE